MPGNRDEFPFSQAEWSLPSYFPPVCTFSENCSVARKTYRHIKVHCIAHRLELAFSDTVKAVPQLEEAKDMLQGIWKHYHYSPKAVRELKELAESMQVKAYKAVKADGTRWVPHL